jgi:hypothetical protein
MAKVSKILKFKSKNGEPVPIYIKTIDGKHIYKTPFQLPDDLGKYIQDFIRPSTSTYLRFGKGLYEELCLYAKARKGNDFALSVADKDHIQKQMKYMMSHYEKLLSLKHSKTIIKWASIRKNPHSSNRAKNQATLELKKELGIVYGIDLHKYAECL